MPKKVVLQDIDDIMQVRKAFDEFYDFCVQLGWERDEIACWLEMKVSKMVEAE